MDKPSVDFLADLSQYIKYRYELRQGLEEEKKETGATSYQLTEAIFSNNQNGDEGDYLDMENDNGWTLIGLAIQAFGQIYG